MQLEHHNSKFQKRKFPIILICDRLSNASNVGSLFRLADAFGVESLWFIGTDTPMGRKMHKASRATHNNVDYKIIDNYLPIVNLKAEGYKLIALEITSCSRNINANQIDKNSKFALIVGNESKGISQELLGQSEQICHIEMYGSNSSINVSTATAIALNKIITQLL